LGVVVVGGAVMINGGPKVLLVVAGSVTGGPASVVTVAVAPVDDLATRDVLHEVVASAMTTAATASLVLMA
jgi:hypothetical protein